MFKLTDLMNDRSSYTRSATEDDRYKAVKITSPDDPLVSNYYEEFSKIFVLPEIRRSEEGLRQWMRTNENKELQAVNGETEHSIIAIVDTQNNNRVVAGWDGVKFSTNNLSKEESNGYLGGAQGTYVWVADGYRKRDNIGFDMLTKLRDTAVGDLEEWATLVSKKDATGRVGIHFEQEDVTRLTKTQRQEDMDATKIDPVRRLEAFMDGLGAKIVQDPKGGAWYAQTAYPEVGQEEINQDGAADYLLITGLWPEGRNPTNSYMDHGIRTVAGVLATDNGRFLIEQHDVINRMEGHMAGPVRQMNLVTLRPELTALKADTVAHIKSTGDMETGQTFGELLNMPPIDSLAFVEKMRPRVQPPTLDEQHDVLSL